MGGLNKSARTAFTEPIGRTRGEQDFPWDTLSVAPARHRCPKIRDFHRAFVCVKGAVGSSTRDPGISVTARTRSVCDRFAAGCLRNASEYIGNNRKFAKTERRLREKLANANRI